MKITVKISPSETTRSHTFKTSDLGYTDKEWDDLTDEEKNQVLEKEVNELPEQPYWTLDSFDEQ